MNLVQYLRSRRDSTEARYSVDDYLGWLQQFTYQGLSYAGMQQTLAQGGPPEEIDRTFRAYVSGAYKANGPVFACTLLRLQVFSQARFQFQRLHNGQLGELFGTPALTLLEKPWLQGTTATLLAQMEVDVTLAGNFFAVHAEGELVRLRPDWTSIVLERRTIPGGAIGWKRVGYVYREGGAQGSPNDDVILLPNEVVHYAPLPDPEASFRGMSWLTPVVRETMADKAATKHKLMFFHNGATPNLMVRTDPAVVDTLAKFRDFVEAMDKAHRGVENAYKTLYLAGAADATVIGSDMKQIEFTATQGKGETRIAMAAGTHPVLVGMSEGMQGSALNAGNYAQVRRRFADTTMWHLWTVASGALETVVPAPPAARLWFDTKGVPFLRDDAKQESEIRREDANTIRTLVDGGFTPESAIAAVKNNDMSLLVHSGKTSVQLIDNSGGDEAAARAQRARDAVDLIRQVYLGTQGGVVVTAEEARKLVAAVGGQLDPDIDPSQLDDAQGVAQEDDDDGQATAA